MRGQDYSTIKEIETEMNTTKMNKTKINKIEINQGN